MEKKVVTRGCHVASSNELESVVDALAEINVQLRHVLQISKTVILELEMCVQIDDLGQEMELESKKQSMLANMSRTEEAIGQMSQEISALLGKRSVKSRYETGFQADAGFRNVAEP